MAGGRRKTEASQAPTTSEGTTSTPQNPSASTEGNTTRVTRSSRGNRDAAAAAASNNDRGSFSSRIKSGLSRIVTLKIGRGRGAEAARETHASQGQSSAPAVSESQDSSKPPQTPRVRRSRRSITEDTPRSTRHSARLRAHLNPFSHEEATLDDENSKQLEPAFDDETKNPVEKEQDVKESPNSLNSSNDTTPTPENHFGDAENPSPTQNGDIHDHSAESDPTEQISKEPSPSDDQNKIDQSNSYPTKQEPLPHTSNTSSPSASRKRKSRELEENDSEFANTSVSPAKKAKIEDNDLGRVSEQPSQNGEDEKNESNSPVDGTGELRMEDELDQVMKDTDTTPETGIELSPTPRARGGPRGRGRRRGRGGRIRKPTRVAPNKRGVGRGRASRGRGSRGGRQLTHSDDVEFRRSPSPSAEAQKLRDRQRELDKAFRKVAAAQRLALAELATQAEKRLTRDKHAHTEVIEYERVNVLLEEQLRQKQARLRAEYKLKVEQEMRLFAGESEVIHQRFRRGAEDVKEEHLLAAQGAYMAFVEGQRAAEDDEHTETEASDAEPDGKISQSRPAWVRGFTSRSVRTPSGAALYQLAKNGWDDFVQRASLGEDIDPQMKEIGQGQGKAKEAVGLLLEATGVVAKEAEAYSALPILADAAAARLPAMQVQRTLHPQVAPGPSFMLPRPQPRRILPAGQQIPPISEQLGLPDPFVGMGPPQLPPPPGSNFQRPPPPGFLPMQPLYYPPPPPPRPPY